METIMNFMTMLHTIYSAISKVFTASDAVLSLGEGYIVRKQKQQSLKDSEEMETFAYELAAQHTVARALAVKQLNEAIEHSRKPSEQAQIILDNILAKID